MSFGKNRTTQTYLQRTILLFHIMQILPLWRSSYEWGNSQMTMTGRI